MLTGSRIKWLVVALVFAVPLAFALFSNHVWEDFYITLRSSRNLVEGNGLVFTPGEKLHTFTSPLGVLVPALCYWLAGSLHEDGAIWIFRLINLTCLAAAAVLVWNRMRAFKVGVLAITVFFAMMAADAKLADFSTDGMETAILVYFALLLWSEMERGEGPQIGVLGLACGALEWARPDAFILGGAIILPHFIFRRRPDGPRRLPLRPLLLGLLLAGVIYLPWFVWAWRYYGSPIPHTIVAKAQFTAPIRLGDMLMIPWRTLTNRSVLKDVFLPAYYFFGSWPKWLPLFGYMLGVTSAFAWLIPGLPGQARRISLAVFIGMFYLCAINLVPWYSPPWAILAYLALAFLLDHYYVAALAARRAWARPLIRVAATVMIGGQVGLLVASAWEMRVQERVVEYHGRREIGRWLHQTASPSDSVFLEPLGYVGYYSQLKMYDIPGLASAEVVAAVKSGRRRITEIIGAVKPTWLVLRPFEFADPTLPQNAVLRDYDLVRTWDVRAELATYTWVPGREWMEHDAVFRVYHRRASAGR